MDRRDLKNLTSHGLLRAAELLGHNQDVSEAELALELQRGALQNWH
jgi:hypothetical protein